MAQIPVSLSMVFFSLEWEKKKKFRATKDTFNLDSMQTPLHVVHPNTKEPVVILHNRHHAFGFGKSWQFFTDPKNQRVLLFVSESAFDQGVVWIYRQEAKTETFTAAGQIKRPASILTCGKNNVHGFGHALVVVDGFLFITDLFFSKYTGAVFCYNIHTAELNLVYRHSLSTESVGISLLQVPCTDAERVRLILHGFNRASLRKILVTLECDRLQLGKKLSLLRCF
jgi:hypothetical protein